LQALVRNDVLSLAKECGLPIAQEVWDKRWGLVPVADLIARQGSPVITQSPSVKNNADEKTAATLSPTVIQQNKTANANPLRPQFS
jgi:hypothetical protein